VLWEADVPGDPYLHHDTKQIADGRVLTLEEREVTDGDQTWTGFAVQAFDPATMVFDYDYDSQSGVDEGVFRPGEGDAWHANWMDLLDHGDGEKLYVSLCNAQTVHAIDVATGSVDWTFGRGGDFELVDPAGQPLPDDHFPQCQHGLEVSEDGTRLLVYDNGRTRKTSRAVEYALDPAAGRATELWSWTDGWYEDTMGDVDWLPGGTVLVTQGHPECWSEGDRTELVEIDPATGQERWRFTFLDEWDAAYRGERLGGCELFSNVGQCPALEPRWEELAPRFGL
jgi:outer membrane protein assembly factor BamB